MFTVSGPDQLLDVERVAVGRVLGRGRGPQRPLHRAPLPRATPSARRRTPPRSGGRRAARSRSRASLQLGVAERFESQVGLGVDARDEERRDGRDLRRIAAARDEPLEPAQVGLDDRAVAVEREDQRDVDRDPAGDALLDRGQTGHRRRDLDEQVGPADLLMQRDRLLERRLGLVARARGRPRARRTRPARSSPPRPAVARRTRHARRRPQGGRRSRPDRRSSPSTPSAARRSRCPFAIACWKIVGFEVMPVTASSSITRCSSPPWTNARER